MTATEIIKEAQVDGVVLTLSPTGTIKATGDGAAVNRWLPAIREHKPEILAVLTAANDPLPEKVGAGDTATHYGWRVTQADGVTQSHHVVPAMTLLEAVGYFAGAASVEPLKEAGIHAPKLPLQPAVEARIRRWLASIDETDPRIIADVLERCQRDPDSLARYIRMAAAVERFDTSTERRR